MIDIVRPPINTITASQAMILQFNPKKWYWTATDGRIYGSEKNDYVYSYDAGYLAFLAKNGAITPWPQDAFGKQTTAALAAVLAQYNIFLPASFV